MLQYLESWLHGTRGLVLCYGVVLACVVAGFRKAQAPPRWYLLAPLLAALALLPGALCSWLISLVVPAPLSEMASLAAYLSLGFALGRWWPAALPGVRHHRGAIVGEGTSTAFQQSSSANPSALTLAGQEVPAGDEAKHFKLPGTTGTGKSTVIRELLAGALARGDRALIANPDGGYLARFYDGPGG